MALRLIVCLGLVAAAGRANAQQVGDTTYRPVIAEPSHAGGAGPRVLIDGAHHNFHTMDGRYAPFARLLRADGYQVDGLIEPWGAGALGDADVLVVANALNERNLGDWSLPTPSAFTPAEIEAVRGWVEGGGALLLIADHMPFPGAAEALAAAFGFRFGNGFAIDTLIRCVQCPMMFRRGGSGGDGGGALADHPITRGVDSVATFTGQAFEAPAGAEPLLVFGSGAIVRLPDVAWQFTDATPVEPGAGRLQGAVLRFGRGRVAVFGEAAMFTAQRAGQDGSVRVGLIASEAAGNTRLVLNLLHWLTAGDEAR